MVIKDSKTGIENDPVVWWKQNAGAYPVLAELAKTHLPLQATSAPSERVFSTASLVISAKRAGLGNEVAGKLLFLKQNWKHHEEMDFTSCL